MKNKRKIIKYCITIILIILLLIFLKEVYREISFIVRMNYKIVLSDNEKLDKSNPMSLEEVKELLEKGTNYNNYVVTKKYENINFKGTRLKECEEKIYVKDNIVKTVMDGKDTFWVDYDKNLLICTDNFVDATMSILHDKSINKKEYFINESKQKATTYATLVNKLPYTSIPSDEFKFEYLGEKDINGRRTIVAKTTNLKSDSYEKYYIDKETGVIVNKENFDYIDFWLFNIPILCKSIHDGAWYLDTGYNFSVEFDCVTDEDIEKPNLAGRVLFNEYYYEENEERNIEKWKELEFYSSSAFILIIPICKFFSFKTVTLFYCINNILNFV